MFGMHPTLLVGPADWDATRLPKEEFLGRIAAFWRGADPGVAGLVVYGDPRAHAELAYFTHFTPKLEPAIALIPRTGALRILVGGGANMIGAAKPLTWVETLLPLRDVGQTIARWERGLRPGSIAMINGGAMRFGLRREMEAVLGTMPPDVTDPVAAAMRRKSPRELALVREACASLQAAFAAMRDAGRAGRGMTDIVLAGERAAWRRGAQDVRTLFGRNGGLSPFTVLDAGEVDPLQVYAAVRHDGYWAEGFGVLSSNVLAAADAARAILGQAESRMRPGALLSEVAKFLADAIGLRRAHPLVDGGFGQHMGLRLQGPDSLKETSTARFAVGEVYTVRVALDHGAAIVSAMVAITDNGHEVLWRGDDA